MSFESDARQAAINTAHKLAKRINFALTTHATHARKLRNATRLWDKTTPYGVHPTWCAMTILQETDLPEDIRLDGYQALLLHDILEDTTASLPEDTSPEVRALVEGMTFESIDQERELVWSRGKEIVLLKLYDKTSNLLEGKTMYPDRKILYVAYMRRLIEEVQKEYGELNIVTIAEAMCSRYETNRKLEAAKLWISAVEESFRRIHAKLDALLESTYDHGTADDLSDEIDRTRQELTKIHCDELSIDAKTYDRAISIVVD
ncbi:MAG: hypothetical protein WC762_13745 [Methylobacter sp.]|jgi:(p)ppGpp synthase/HD superfamily hydrolase